MQACRSVNLEIRTCSDHGTTHLSTQPPQILRCVQKKAQQITGLTHQSKTLLFHWFLPAAFKRALPLASRQHNWATLTRTAELEANRPLLCHVLEHAARCTKAVQNSTAESCICRHSARSVYLSELMEKFCYSVTAYKRTWPTRRNTKNSNLTTKNTEMVCIRVGQFKSQWRAVVNMIKSISVPVTAVNLLTSYMPVSISRSSLPHENTRLLTTSLIVWNVSIGEFQCLKYIRF